MSEVACLIGDVSIIPGNTAYETVVLNILEDDGTRWYLTDVEGWWTLPPPNLLDIPRPQKQDGSYDVEGNYLARLVTISGMFIPIDKALVATKRSRLLRACDSMRGASTQLIFNEDPPKMAYARLIDQPSVTTDKANGQTTFQLPFKCIDPRKYSVTEHSLSVGAFTFDGVGRVYDLIHDRTYDSEVVIVTQIEATNDGSVNTAPIIYLYGPLADPEILNFTTGESLAFPGLRLLDGQMMTIDVMEHSALVGTSAQRVSYLAYDSVWWTLPPGSSTIRLLANDGYGGPAAGSMTFTWRSAWME